MVRSERGASGGKERAAHGHIAMAEDDFGLDDAILSAAEDLLKETDGIDESEGAAHGGEAGAAGTGSGFRDVPIAPSQHKVGQ